MYPKRPALSESEIIKLKKSPRQSMEIIKLIKLIDKLMIIKSIDRKLTQERLYVRAFEFAEISRVMISPKRASDQQPLAVCHCQCDFTSLESPEFPRFKVLE